MIIKVKTKRNFETPKYWYENPDGTTAYGRRYDKYGNLIVPTDSSNLGSLSRYQPRQELKVESHQTIVDTLESSESRYRVMTGYCDDFYVQQENIREGWAEGTKPPKELILGEVRQLAHTVTKTELRNQEFNDGLFGGDFTVTVKTGITQAIQSIRQRRRENLTAQFGAV